VFLSLELHPKVNAMQIITLAVFKKE